MASSSSKSSIPSASQALPGRSTPLVVPEAHFVNQPSHHAAVPGRHAGGRLRHGLFLGCREAVLEAARRVFHRRRLRRRHTPNPTYQEVCSGQTGHTEVVKVIFDPKVTSYEDLLETFWERHNPTEGMRQGNDIGTQYRSAIYTHGPEQQRLAEESRVHFQKQLTAARMGTITTEIREAPTFYYAEDYHQQYLAKNPDGYCPNHSCGIPYKSAVLYSGEKA
jgi:peptide-methionine (S)-S-oxide reductase